MTITSSQKPKKSSKAKSKERVANLEGRIDILFAQIEKLTTAFQNVMPQTVVNAPIVKPIAIAVPEPIPSGKRIHDSFEDGNNEEEATGMVEVTLTRKPKKKKTTEEEVKPAENERTTEPPEIMDESFISVKSASSRREEKREKIAKRPPPIVLHNVATDKVDSTTRQIISAAEGRASFRCGGKSISVITTNKEDWTRVKAQLQSTADIEYHTYTHADEKRLAYVMRGAHQSVNPEEIELTLKDQHKIEAKVSLMTFRRRTSERTAINVPMPLFQIIVAKDTAIEKLLSIREMGHYKVTWEKKRGRAQVTQCRNCQRYGHTATNCGRTYRCIKCTECHEPGKCGNTVEQQKPAECVNCGQQHPANYSKCQVRERFISNTHSRKPPPTRIPSGLGLRKEGISYAQVTTCQPQKIQSSPSSNNVDRLLQESEDLFGMNLFDLKSKCDLFFTEYDQITNQGQKRLAYLKFISSLPLNSIC